MVDSTHESSTTLATRKMPAGPIICAVVFMRRKFHHWNCYTCSNDSSDLITVYTVINSYIDNNSMHHQLLVFMKQVFATYVIRNLVSEFSFNRRHLLSQEMQKEMILWASFWDNFRRDDSKNELPTVAGAVPRRFLSCV